jgi:hypothetical protein
LVRATERFNSWSIPETALDLGRRAPLGGVRDLSKRFMGVSTGRVGSFPDGELVFCGVLQFGSCVYLRGCGRTCGIDRGEALAVKETGLLAG